ncbi:hypothetical protein ACFE04_013395 [Oxalis oulophora]
MEDICIPDEVEKKDIAKELKTLITFYMNLNSLIYRTCCESNHTKGSRRLVKKQSVKGKGEDYWDMFFCPVATIVFHFVGVGLTAKTGILALAEINNYGRMLKQMLYDQVGRCKATQKGKAYTEFPLLVKKWSSHGKDWDILLDDDQETDGWSCLFLKDESKP